MDLKPEKGKGQRDFHSALTLFPPCAVFGIMMNVSYKFQKLIFNSLETVLKLLKTVKKYAFKLNIDLLS